MNALQDELNNSLQNLKLNVPEQLGADDTLDELNWNNVVNSIKILTECIASIKDVPTTLPAVGSPYIRCPGMTVPWEQFKATYKEQWIAVHDLYPGDFMRLAGGNASKFKADSTQISHDSGVKGDGGGQLDAIKRHYHQSDYPSGWGLHYIGGDNAGGYPGGNTKNQTSDAFANTTEETRPSNFTIELYIFKG